MMPTDNKEPIATIPFVAPESAMFRMERINKRLLIAVVVAVVALVATNAAWAIHIFG